jgi:hypothetical protein
LLVGTKGLGKGSFTHLTYWENAIPKEAQPTAEQMKALRRGNRLAGATIRELIEDGRRL